MIDTKESWVSRKFFLTLFCIMLIAGGGAYATVSPVFLTIYSIFIGGILGAASLYMTGNISEKILAGKVNASVEIARKKKKRVEPVIQGE